MRSHAVPILPVEVWLHVFKFLCSDSLWQCREVCTLWRGEVLRLVRTGGLAGRYLVCKRLFYTEGDDCLDHRKSIRNSLSVSVSSPVLLSGIYMYTGNDTDLLDETIEVVFDRGTTVLSMYRDNKLISQIVDITTTAEARATTRKKDHIKNMDIMRLNQPVVLERDVWYDMELVIYPTDVTNHYSGYPITRCGAELWTCYGKGGKTNMKSHGVKFSFGASSRGGRSCLSEGQIPWLLFWPLEQE